jgi:hypothetical protein
MTSPIWRDEVRRPCTAPRTRVRCVAGGRHSIGFTVVISGVALTGSPFARRRTRAGAATPASRSFCARDEGGGRRFRCGGRRTWARNPLERYELSPRGGDVVHERLSQEVWLDDPALGAGARPSAHMDRASTTSSWPPGSSVPCALALRHLPPPPSLGQPHGHARMPHTRSDAPRRGKAAALEKSAHRFPTPLGTRLPSNNETACITFRSPGTGSPTIHAHTDPTRRPRQEEAGRHRPLLQWPHHGGGSVVQRRHHQRTILTTLRG